MAILVSTAKTQLGLLKKDISDVTDATFVQWCETINTFVYRELVKVDPERFILESTITVTAGTNSYALPADFMHVQVEGTGLYEPDSNSYATDRRFTQTGYGSGETGWYISGTNLVLTPPNYPNSDTLTLRYIPKPTAIDATTDYFTVNTAIDGVEIIPDEYMNYVVKALDCQYTQWDETPGSEGFSDHRFMNVLNELLDNFRREGKAFGMPDVSNIY